MNYLPPLQVLWDYLSLHLEPQKADLIVGFGCYDDNIPRRAAQLYLQGYAPKILFTGGLGRNTTGLFTEPEAQRFAEIALACGVPKGDILVEDKSTNTKENIHFTRDLLEAASVPHGTILGVHKPYMERRIKAAMGVYWPEQPFSVTSPQLTLEEALKDSFRQGMEEKETISTIVGDFQRIEVYAQKGYQLPQFIPEEAWRAYHQLIQMGFTSQLVK